MNLLSLFAFTVYAAGTVISPIPDDIPVITLPTQTPNVSFGQIVDASEPDVSFGQIVAIPTPVVLGETNTASPSPTPQPEADRPQAETPIITKKQSYTIAFLGDSMTDTMGPGLPAIDTFLSGIYKTTEFLLLNFGIGGTNIDDAIGRISLFASISPDIVVLESCAYNPYPNEIGLDRHWIALARAVETLQSSIPGVKIIIAATIAPNSKVFGDGAPNIAFSPEDKIQRTTAIKQYLDSTVKFAASQHLPVADAYHTSLDGAGEGKLMYINSGDHIHYSEAGRELFAQKISEAIVNNRLLE
jgi:hypothetical protein